MADIANLARHLLMAEVLQICESVHKQVEEHKLTVYQRGPVHTMVQGQSVSHGESNDASGAYMVTIPLDGQAVVTNTDVAATDEALDLVAPPKEAYIQEPITIVTQGEKEEAVQVHSGQFGQNEAVTLITHAGQVEPGETVTLISHGGEGAEGQTMTVITHSGQAGASESLAVVSACLAMEQPQVVEAEAEAFVINVDAEKVSHSEAVNLADVTAPVLQNNAIMLPKVETTEVQLVEDTPQPVLTAPLKRKRGRPAKVKKDVVVEDIPMEEGEPPAEESQGDKQEMTVDDPNRRRLRQRSIGEGGYARLHMGLENEEEDAKGSTPPSAATPKVHL